MGAVSKTNLTLFIFLLLLFADFAQAQSDSTEGGSLKKEAPKIFLDCSSCDGDYIQTEITFVNYVRDRKDADVHVLVTTQATGSGGTEFTIAFSGRERFQGIDSVGVYVSSNTETSDEIRTGFTRQLKLGLLEYALKTPIAARLLISMDEKEDEKIEASGDKWDYWVFDIGGSGYTEGEQTWRYLSFSGSVSANRITPSFKFRSSYNIGRSDDTYYLSQGDIRSSSKSQTFNLLAVKSLTDHWSAGAGLQAYASSNSNTDFALKAAPAVEYNVFPYSNSTRRQLRILWKPGFNHYRYGEETIYDKERESLWGESVNVTLELKEKWGNASSSFQLSHYFSDLRKNRMSIYVNMSVRLYKGLSFNTYGSFTRISDQLSLPKGEASIEDILLRRRQLATSHSYYGYIGLGYTFGSSYSNVVNPRFNGY
jgi:hypothetical protein